VFSVLLKETEIEKTSGDIKEDREKKKTEIQRQI
jgi:hypothetical protein